MAEKSIGEVDFTTLLNGPFHPSPAAWEDQVFYFLLVDRFSDGQEQGGYNDINGNPVAGGSTPLLQASGHGNAVGTTAEADAWRAAGTKYCGGTLKGLESKIGYLKRLGVTAIWISPVFKQVAFQETYHGYGIQDYLDVEPRFGTRDDLRRVVDAAHKNGIYVILDIILNHAGNVFSYNPDRYDTVDQNTGRHFLDPRWDGRPYAVAGYNDKSGQPAIPFGPVDLNTHPNAWPDGAIWPREFQAPATYTRKGRISNFDHDPEYREGDFFDLKDVGHGAGGLDDYRPSPALLRLCDIYKFWMAFADLDGFRIDTVKHMDPGATRFFGSVLHEFAQKLGKENFYLIGEITGGRAFAFTRLEETGLDAALGIDDIPVRLADLVKGKRNPAEYFNLFRNSVLVNKEAHTWFRNKVVTVIDDHDMVSRGENKARFCADGAPASLALASLALNVTTLGIPCIYYGSEQLFDGAYKPGTDPKDGNDRYIREAMFGGTFGPFRSKGGHCFDETSWVYQEFAKIMGIRRATLALRRGRQYLREISGNGVNYGLPQMIGGEIRSVVPWSRLFDLDEILCAINTDRGQALTASAVVDADIQAGRNPKQMTCLYSTDAQQIGRTAAVQPRGDGAMVVSITVPAAGFVIFQ
jgi:glycosidase